MAKTVYLVSCVSEKLTFAAPACELYISDWFLKASAYAQQKADVWFMLSAKFGLLSTDRIIEPYNLTLKTMPARERRAWACRVLTELRTILKPGDRVVLLAGKPYREYLVDPIINFGCDVEVPMEHLGIGQQKGWLKKQIGDPDGD